MTHASGAKALMSSLIVPAAQMYFFVSKGTSNINTQSSQCMWTKYVHGSNTSYNMLASVPGRFFFNRTKLKNTAWY